MGSPDGSTRLIVNADDFGRSHSINQAVIQAHTQGILTTASLMVNGDAAAEAVQLARQHPSLGVGLHLVLACGKSALPLAEIPALVDRHRNFFENPVQAGLAYSCQPCVHGQIEKELEAQFRKFTATGLRLDHVNGHLHFHLHPTVFSILMRRHAEWGVTALRLTRDRFWLNWRIEQGRLAYRISHAVIFGLLACWARGALRRRGIRHTSAVFGLLQDGLVTEQYLTQLLPRLPTGELELYSHPSTTQFRHELEALTSPRIQQLLSHHHIQLIRYQDL